ncbi:scarecrow-like protein 8 [Phoenix dactylifera]|uniref:Scarecrow-like protein 8 n=1 Tax=Phoenix dactylifera TaxID=42345 RepID=A0A8B7BQT2_PHODC|nr:scarecrow-like protein 8 [Phoenix dactylifera]
MASGFPGRDLRRGFGFGAGSAIQVPPFANRSERGGGGGGAAAAAAGGLLKRSLNEMDRQQQLQLQHALFLRSVKPRTHHASPFSPLSSVGISSSAASSFSSDHSAFTTSSSSSLSASSLSSGLGYARRQHPNPNPNPSPPDLSFSTAATGPAAAPSCVTESENKVTVRNRLLEELERRLLDDEDEDEDVVSASGCSAVTTNEWSEAMQQLLSPPPATVAAQHPLSPSPTTSSSSSTSSSASCSPPSATPSRQMLSDTVAAIVDGNLEAAAANLAVLKRAANPHGDPEQRLTAMMVAALCSRLETPTPSSGALHRPTAELCSTEHLAATQMLHDLSPCFQHALFAANLAILEATRDSPRIHILDFDVGQGSQYMALIQALAERHRHRPSARPPNVKITAVADPTSPFNSFSNGSGGLRMVGDRLAKLAEGFGVGLRFSIVCRRASELDEAALGCEPGEALAVNLAFVLSRVADESVSPANPRDELLRRVRALGPRVVALVEQEMNSNTAPFAARFAEACGHYGALLGSLEATLGRESGKRSLVEACLARKAANSVAREGADRVERCEVFGKWRARMGMAGFRSVPLGPAVSEPVKARLASPGSNPGFTVKEEAGGICFGWSGRVLTVASAWR